MTNWNERYNREEHEHLRQPSSSLMELLPENGRGKALDIACGDGRNAIFLAKEGYEVRAVDYSEVAIGKAEVFAEGSGVNVEFICADLEKFTIGESSCDLIICYYYLQRSLINAMKKGLKKNGTIIFETYTLDQRDMGHPKNRDFLLAPNELLSLFNDLQISYYREGIVVEEGIKKAVASIACSKT